MIEPCNPLVAFSDYTAKLIERTAGRIVAVHGGGRWPSSGIELGGKVRASWRQASELGPTDVRAVHQGMEELRFGAYSNFGVASV